MPCIALDRQKGRRKLLRDTFRKKAHQHPGLSDSGIFTQCSGAIGQSLISTNIHNENEIKPANTKYMHVKWTFHKKGANRKHKN